MWKVIKNSVLRYGSTNTLTNKLAIFDLDQTLIKPRDSRKFSNSADDWQWMNSKIKNKLRKLHKENYSVVIISNQAGLNNNKTRFSWFKKKIENIHNELKVPFLLYAAMNKDIYRKPNTGMIEFVLDYIFKKIGSVDKLFYVGDAVGRKYDHSDSDLKFAYNLELILNNVYLKKSDKYMKCPFYTPEQYFLGKDKSKKYKIEGFDPEKYIKDAKSKKYKFKKSSKQEMIMMFGFPGSGKSHFAKEISKKYQFVYTSQDEHKTRTIKIADDALNRGKTVVIDNTHLTENQRSKYIAVAKKHKVPIRILVMTSDKKEEQLEYAKHMNMFRQRTGDSKSLKDTIYSFMSKSYSYPTLDSVIKKIEIVPYIPKFSKTSELVRYLQRE